MAKKQNTLTRQIKKAKAEFKKWPRWMKRAAKVYSTFADQSALAKKGGA